MAAALIKNGRVLAARRSAPHRLAGGWEFPGGKLEPGEEPESALVRECAEELGIGIAVGGQLAVAMNDEIRLVLFAATVVSGEPAPLEDHDELRWLGAADLETVAWLPIDAGLLGSVTPLLR